MIAIVSHLKYSIPLAEFQLGSNYDTAFFIASRYYLKIKNLVFPGYVSMSQLSE